MFGGSRLVAPSLSRCLPKWGITAGSGFAVIELRVLLLECLDEVAARFPDVPLGIYVDDANQHAAGPEARVV